MAREETKQKKAAVSEHSEAKEEENEENKQTKPLCLNTVRQKRKQANNRTNKEAAVS